MSNEDAALMVRNWRVWLERHPLALDHVLGLATRGGGVSYEEMFATYWDAAQRGEVRLDLMDGPSGAEH